VVFMKRFKSFLYSIPAYNNPRDDAVIVMDTKRIDAEIKKTIYGGDSGNTKTSNNPNLQTFENELLITLHRKIFFSSFFYE